MNQLLGAKATDLPEHILKHKWAGNFDAAIRAIDFQLTQEGQPALRDLLRIERECLSRMPSQYPYTRAEAIAAIREKVPSFEEAEFDRIETEGGIDFLYIHGEPHYFAEVVAGVLRWDRSLLARAGEDTGGARPILDEAIAQMQQHGELAYEIRMCVEYRINDEAFVPGERYKVHLPVPKPCAQQSNIRIIAEEDGKLAPEGTHQRTVYYERTMQENKPFCVEYTYESRVRYIDLLARPHTLSRVYPHVAPPALRDLSELPPHIRFTPLLRKLAAQVRGDMDDALLVARAAYDFVTQKVTYSFLRDYVLIDHMSEYMALGLRGDCGAQALLFMALCRLNGISARWQSGTCASPESTGAHDWCQFFVEPYGWLFCDVSFGGSAWQAGQIARWNFYFGNLDPFRMVANDQYMGDFTPAFLPLRQDPFDNQSGECELMGRALLSHERTVTRAIEVARI